jgi:hypothetical protein
MLLTTITCLLVLAGNTVIDQTKQLQQLLNNNTGKTVTFPAGTYMVRTIEVPAHTHLIIGSKTVVKGLSTGQNLPVIKLNTGVQLTGNGLIDGNRGERQKGTGIQAFDANNLLVSDIRIQNVAEQGIQLAGCKAAKLINVQVNRCGAKGVNQAQGINIVTSQNIQVSNCRISNAQHGIQWWGDNTGGWCDNIKITGNRVSTVQGGGIWGNKGRHVAVASNIVETCGDVGVDFENSTDCSATGNVVRNCKNYGLATFYGSERVVFTNNTVIQSATCGHGIGLVGSGISKNITFQGGSVTTRGISSCGLVTVGANVATDIVVRNMRIVSEGSGAIPIRVLDNNKFTIVNNPLISGMGPTGISLEGASLCTVTGNVIVHGGNDKSKLGERGGIFVFFRSAEYPAQHNVVRMNTIRGYVTGINDECWGNVNSNNTFEQNNIPNLVHRGSDGAWGGKAILNRTFTKRAAPVSVIK